MRKSRLVLVLVLVCVLVYLMVLKRHYDSHNALPLRPPQPAPKAVLVPDWLVGSWGRIQFGIMFDAGSTGTRVHVFKFRLDQNQSFPQLLEENFKSISPGLSAFAEDPLQCRVGLLQLLDLARSIVPVQVHGSTPLFLKATAGLRLLQEDQAQRLLDQVRVLFRSSPFLSSDQNVSILDGAEEGVSAWLTVNFLLGAVGGAAASVGILDLGGGSTQVTFSPRSKFVESQTSDLQTLRLFSATYRLYTHSYLGLGLMEARAAVLGRPSSAPGGALWLSPCLVPDSVGSWEHDHVLYSLRGQRSHTGSVFQACSERVRSVLKDTVRPVEQQQTFYAFSYYYDRAEDIQALHGDKGGSVSVKDFSSAAQRVCEGQALKSDQSLFLCLDLVYISVLLQELGFSPDSELKLVRWIGSVETSWALGATVTNMNF
ncbi:ectonucleoside triphosphate diphosphohydrolase 6 [Eucyclogobius newberryi]|uniref:ectonucleoside triphosphate diphosphohydrolase 6 n=1 Tax=Eucyclogobius newberryi TaxID=166745 RepID=UPI003B59E755